MALKINLYKNKNSESDNYGKVYGRVEVSTPMSIAELAAHIAEHGSIVTEDVLVAVLKKAAKCIRELVLKGQSVKLDDLCILKPAVSCKPAASVEAFELGTNVKVVRLLCSPTGKMRRTLLTTDAVLAYTSLAQRIKNGEVTLSNQKGKYLEEATQP